MLAVVKATEHFRVYLLGKSYKLRTDHSLIKGLEKSKLEIMRVERWAMRLSGYEFDVEVVRGRDNGVADALSCIQLLEGTERYNEPPSDKDEFCIEYAGVDDITDVTSECAYVEIEEQTVEDFAEVRAPTLESIRLAQEADEDYVRVRSWILSDGLPAPDEREGLSKFLRACVQSFAQLHIVEGVLVIYDQDG